MSLPTIRKYLSEKIIDLDPAIVAANNPDLYDSPCAVGDYAYKSFGANWLIGGVVSSQRILDTIVYKMNVESSKQEIGLIHLPETSYVNSDGRRENTPGAVDYWMEIVYKLPRAVSDYDRLINTSLSLRYWLDHDWISKRKGVATAIKVDPPVDKSLGGGFYCFYKGNVTPPNENEVVERWLVWQDLKVPKAPRS